MVRSEHQLRVCQRPLVPQVLSIKWVAFFNIHQPYATKFVGMKTWEDPLLNLESYFSQSPSSSRVRVSLKKTGVASD